MRTMMIGQVARYFGEAAPVIRRIANKALGDNQQRVQHFRVFYSEDLPVLEQALREEGYLENWTRPRPKSDVEDASGQAWAGSNSCGAAAQPQYASASIANGA